MRLTNFFHPYYLLGLSGAVLLMSVQKFRVSSLRYHNLRDILQIFFIFSIILISLFIILKGWIKKKLQYPI